MIKCLELGKEFATKEELFDALKSNMNDIISIKKKSIFKSCEKGASLNVKPLDFSKLTADETKNIALDDKHYYIAVNSTGILDSHKDVHLPSIWNKSAKEQSFKNYLVDSHIMSINTTLVKKEYVEIFVAKVPFSVLGKNYKGQTEILVYKFPKDKVINEKAKQWLDSGDSIEASVRMQYVDIVLAMNSDRKEDKNEKKTYDELVSIIANKEDFDEILYFWGVKEAKNLNESSLVLFGSNSTTGQLIEPLKNTQTIIEPSKDTRRKLLLNL